MQKIFKVILMPLLLWGSGYTTVYSQTEPKTVINSSISGIVSDSKTRQPLAGAGIKIKGTTHEVVTDNNGRFEFRTGQSLPYTIIISYVGYETIEQVANDSVVEVNLSPSNKALDELLVVGYVQARQSSLTGSVTRVASNDFSRANYASITEKLQGQVPGLSISNNSGVAGTSVLVRLRGATSITAGNDPLYIIDGVFINNENLQALSRGLGGQTPNPLADLNPEDIESVSVLKDASATAVYGSRGANGVILITTRRGSKNTGTKLNLGAEHGYAKAQDLWDLVTGPEHADLVNLVHLNDGKSFATRPFRPKTEVIAGFPAYGTPEQQPTFDRVSDVFRVAQSQRYTLSVSGGDARTNFYIGGEYQDQETVLKLQDFSRFSFRINLDHTIRKNLKIGTSNSLSRVPRRLVRVGDGPAGLFQAALHTPTFYPYYNDDGTYSKPTVFDNHIAILENSDTHSESLRSINNVFAILNLLPNLSLKSSWSNDLNLYRENAYYNTFLVYGQPSGEANVVTTRKQTLIAEQVLNYNAKIASGDFAAFLGNTVQYTTTERETLTGTGFPSNQFKKITSAAVQTASSTGSSNGLISFFAGANYSYDRRYNIEANIRADGSSRFGSDRRWGYFPSVGLGWNISNEHFFPQTSKVSTLRLKTSYGITGNEDIDDFASRGLWTGGRNYNDEPGIAPSQLGNPSLKWETTRQFNAGLESALFDGKLGLEFNYYVKNTFDLLLDEPVRNLTGFSTVVKNVGQISNKGVELLVNTRNIERRNFSWRTTFTIAHNKNKIEKLLTAFTGSYGMYRLEQGYSLYSIWVFNYLGINPATGDAIYEDVKKDGVITSDDRKIVGNVWPRFEGVLRNTFTFKSFDINLNLYYKYGNKLFNYTAFFLDAGGTRGVTRSIQKSALNYWKQPGDDNVLPRPTSLQNADGSRNYESNNSRFLEDASFIRLRDLTIGYNLPASVASAIRFSKVRLYVTGTNLFTLTKYSGPDPEANTAADSENGLVQGLDFNTVPQPIMVTAGINLTF